MRAHSVVGSIILACIFFLTACTGNTEKSDANATASVNSSYATPTPVKIEDDSGYSVGNLDDYYSDLCDSGKPEDCVYFSTQDQRAGTETVQLQEGVTSTVTVAAVCADSDGYFNVTINGKAGEGSCQSGQLATYALDVDGNNKKETTVTYNVDTDGAFQVVILVGRKIQN